MYDVVEINVTQYIAEYQDDGMIIMTPVLPVAAREVPIKLTVCDPSTQDFDMIRICASAGNTLVRFNVKAIPQLIADLEAVGRAHRKIAEKARRC